MQIQKTYIHYGTLYALLPLHKYTKRNTFVLREAILYKVTGIANQTTWHTQLNNLLRSTCMMFRGPQQASRAGACRVNSFVLANRTQTIAQLCSWFTQIVFTGATKTQNNLTLHPNETGFATQCLRKHVFILRRRPDVFRALMYE